MASSAETIVISSSSLAPSTPTVRPKAKTKSKKTKADIEAELGEAKVEIAHLRAHAANFDMHSRKLADSQAIVRNDTRKLREAEVLLYWGFEQQEAVLIEAVEKGVELAHAVLEQRYILEQEFKQRWRVAGQVGGSCDTE